MQTLQLPADKHGEQEGAIQVAGYGGRVFLRGCRSKWFEFDDENGRNGWLFVTTFSRTSDQCQE